MNPSDGPSNPCDTDPWICSALLAKMRTPANPQEISRLQELRQPRWNRIYRRRVELLTVRRKPKGDADCKWLADFWKMDLKRRIVDGPWGRPATNRFPSISAMLGSRRRSRSQSPDHRSDYKRVRTAELSQSERRHVQRTASSEGPLPRFEELIASIKTSDENSDETGNKTNEETGDETEDESDNIKVYRHFPRQRRGAIDARMDPHHLLSPWPFVIPGFHSSTPDPHDRDGPARRWLASHAHGDRPRSEPPRPTLADMASMFLHQ